MTPDMKAKYEAFAQVYNDTEQYPHLADVAFALGIAYQTARNYATTLRRLFEGGQDVPQLVNRKQIELQQLAQSERGDNGFKPVLPGFALKKTSSQIGPDGELQKEWVQQTKAPGEEFEVPEGHKIKGVSALLDASGRVMQQWVKTKEGEFDLETTVELLKTAFADLESTYTPVPAPQASADSLLTLLPCADWHIGLYTWAREVGEEWNLEKAERVIGDAAVDAINRSPISAVGVILGGGDLLHADNSQNRTAKSGNALDVDGRYPACIQAAGRIKVRAIEAALARCERVIVRILPGNHDEHTAHAIAYFLSAWFRNEPRVTVDLDPGLFFWHRFGKVMLGATHGHATKMEKMPMVMAHRRAEDWGQTRFRYVHGFHIHHRSKVATEGEGVVCESHQAPCPQDAWHFGEGFLSGRSIQTITYHRDYGEVSRARVAILEAA